MTVPISIGWELSILVNRVNISEIYLYNQNPLCYITIKAYFLTIYLGFFSIFLFSEDLCFYLNYFKSRGFQRTPAKEDEYGDSRLWPCVTFVLIFGGHWDGSRDIHGILDMRDISEELQAYVNNYPIHVIEVGKFQNTDVFRTDLKQIFDFIHCSKERDKLITLVQNGPAYQEMDEAAYDMVSEYVNEEGLIEITKEM